MITLQPVNETNFLAVCALKPAREQQAFVLPAPMILARAYAYRAQRARAWAICLQEQPVGVLLVEDMEEEPSCYHLAELLIDEAYQQKGYAAAALRLLLPILQAEKKFPRIELCVKRENHAAIQLYASFGFMDSGYTDPDAPDSICMVRPLQTTLAAALGFSAQDALRIDTAFSEREATYRRWAETAYDGEVPDFPICRRMPLERLVCVLVKLVELRGRYAEKGIDEDVFFATASDVRLHQRLYFEKTGQLGLSRSDVIWLRHLFGCRLFQLGSLQFQMLPMIYLDQEGCGEDYMRYAPEQKERLPAGSPVINVHIPHGADLSPQAVEESFSYAAAFFARHFDYHARAFLCCSWLLYPGMRPLLPPHSNIAQFAARWTIIGEAKDASEAISRIYGGRRGKTADYPQRTSLQRAALHHFSCLGEAYGIIEIA